MLHSALKLTAQNNLAHFEQGLNDQLWIKRYREKGLAGLANADDVHAPEINRDADGDQHRERADPIRVRLGIERNVRRHQREQVSQ